MPKPLVGLACLSLAACAAVPPPAAAPTSMASPATAAPSPVATSLPGPVATQLPGPFPTPMESYPPPPASAPAPGGRTAVVSGNVYDAAGAPVDNAIVRVTSLDPSVPYIASTSAAQGSYVVNNVPEGAQVEITVSLEGWTTRRRVGTFDGLAGVNQLDFGSSAPGKPADARAAAFFLSKYPEIAHVSPALDAALVEPTSLAYVLALSEPLDAPNRRRFEDALRIFPANLDAAGTAAAASTYQDLTQALDANTGSQADYRPDQAWAYAIAKGSALDAASQARASVTWNTRGDEATLAFPAPLLAGRGHPARYQVGLVAGPEPIRDADGNQLGTDRMDRHSAYPAPGSLIHGAIARAQLAALPAGADPWAATHQLVAGFQVQSSGQAPRLLGVAYEAAGRDSRIAMRFDKSLAAFNGKPGGQRSPRLAFVDTQAAGNPGYDISDGAETDPLAMFTFAAGESGLPALGSSPSTSFDPTQANAVWTEAGRGFRFARDSLTLRARTALVAGRDDGRVTLEVDPDAPTTLYIYVFNRPRLFDPRLTTLSARVQDLQDPAGNAIGTGDADRFQVKGPL